MEMGKYILSILLTEPNVIMSWGFSCPMSIKNGLLFHVSGFRHKGFVLVSYDEIADLFNINLYNTDKSEADSFTGIYGEDLVCAIDNRVEKTDNYDDDVEAWINGF